MLQALPMVRRFYLLLLLCCCSLVLKAQKEKTNWYFGIGGAITFEDGDPKVLNNNPLTEYNNCSGSMSDPNTGELLFYTNGKEVRDGNHQIVPSKLAELSSNASNLVILENPFIDGEYFLVVMAYGAIFPSSPVLQYYTVNVSPTGVTMSQEPVLFARAYFFGLTAVRNCTNEGYWLITYNLATNQFMTFSVGATVEQAPVFSDASTTIGRVGSIMSNNTGEKVAISEYDADLNQAAVYTFNMDKECGKLTLDQELNFPNGEYAYGLSFSNNNKYLYATYSVGQSDLVQFDLATGAPTLIAHSTSNYNQMQMGPDGRIYIATHEGGIPGPRIDAINDPDQAGASCLYEKGKLTLTGRNTSNFHFPNFIQDYTNETCDRVKPRFELEGLCLGEDLDIEKKTDFEVPDSFFWVIEEDTFTELLPEYTPAEVGTLSLKFVRMLCDEAEESTYEVEVGEVRSVDLGPDTAICKGASLELNAGIGNDTKYLWRHNGSGDSLQTISSPGEYWVQADVNGCKSKDSVNVRFKPDVWVDLGGEHFLCEDENDLVLLDAGKGFHTYNWTPTGDTTQWIHVSLIDTYYVIVEDFRGCKGDDNAIVRRRCSPFLFFPTAFSPNGDALNDEFKPIGQDIIEFRLEVYNVWGELVFQSMDPNDGWDGEFKGTKSPIGRYLWTCSYSGYRNKKHTQQHFETGYLILVE